MQNKPWTLLWLSFFSLVAPALFAAESSTHVIPPNNSMRFDLSSLFNDATVKAINAANQELYEIQQSGHISFGHLRLENSGATLRPLSISLPRVSTNGGCESIDIYGGGIFFANDPRYVKDLLKKILQNSGTYAFNLALKELNPSIQSTLNDVAAIAQKANEFQIDSCEVAQSLVDPLHRAVLDIAAHKETMNNIGTGLLSDYYSAKNSILKKFKMIPFNITYQILTLEHPGAKALTTNELALAMNLLGTIIPGGENADGTMEKTKSIDPLDFYLENPRELRAYSENGKKSQTEDFPNFVKARGLHFLLPERVQQVLSSYILQLERDTEALDEPTRREMECLVGIADFPILPYLNISSEGKRNFGKTQLAKGVREALILQIFDQALGVYANNLALIDLEAPMEEQAREILQKARHNYHHIADHRSLNISDLMAETAFRERLMADRVAKQVLDWQKNVRSGRR